MKKDDRQSKQERLTGISWQLLLCNSFSVVEAANYNGPEIHPLVLNTVFWVQPGVREHNPGVKEEAALVLFCSLWGRDERSLMGTPCPALSSMTCPYKALWVFWALGGGDWAPQGQLPSDCQRFSWLGADTASTPGPGGAMTLEPGVGHGPSVSV